MRLFNVHTCSRINVCPSGLSIRTKMIVWKDYLSVKENLCYILKKRMHITTCLVAGKALRRHVKICKYALRKRTFFSILLFGFVENTVCDIFPVGLFLLLTVTSVLLLAS